MIESAVDRNITFRLKGSGCLKINDVNVMSLVRLGTNTTASPNLLNRLNLLEDRINLLGQGNSNRGINNRLNRLENRSRTTGNNPPMIGVNRRIRQLETRLDALVNTLRWDNCTSNPCKNGGSCMSKYNGYVCKCSDAWTGINCDLDVNECALYAGTDLGCQNGATCSNTLGAYE